MSHFRALHLSLFWNRENITSPSLQASISELRVSGNGEEGCIRLCLHWISSLESTRAWFQCLSIWCFSPLSGNIFSTLYFDFLPLPSVLSSWRQNDYWAIKRENIFLGFFNDNFLVCVTFIAECNHSLSMTTHLGEKCISLSLVLSPCHLYGVDSTPRAEGAVQALRLRASNPAIMFDWNCIPVFWNWRWAIELHFQIPQDLPACLGAKITQSQPSVLWRWDSRSVQMSCQKQHSVIPQQEGYLNPD